MNRRDLLRNALITIGAASVNWPANALEFAPGDDASVELARADWKPVFLDAQQNDSLIALGDAIIPATDSPGAKAALANRFLDLLLSVMPERTQKEFVESLAYIDAAAKDRYKAAFTDLTPEQKNEFLAAIVTHTYAMTGETAANSPAFKHFTRLKAMISSAYYTSPIGLKELGWDGYYPHGIFTGCEHMPDEHQSAK